MITEARTTQSLKSSCQWVSLTEAREAVSQGYDSVILETILKVTILFTGHSRCSHGSLLRADLQTHQPQLGVSSLTYQGQT